MSAVGVDHDTCSCAYGPICLTWPLCGILSLAAQPRHLSNDVSSTSCSKYHQHFLILTGATCRRQLHRRQLQANW